MVSLLPALSLLAVSYAAEHHYKWNVTYIDGNPDGMAEVHDVVGCNGQYPWPDISVETGDRVIVEVYNGLGIANTSVHFHGLFQEGTNAFDGVPNLTQCEIPPGNTMIYNFTVPDQVGTFWYHSHSKGQYMDGMRGAFIINDPENPYKDQFDEEVVLQIAEWYHENITTLTSAFLNRYNPTGAEPIPDALLFNGTMNGTWNVEPDTTYYMRLINSGGFVSQYVWMEDHTFTVVAIDGLYVEPNETEVIYITVAQRYDVLIHTKNTTDKNYAFMQRFDIDMLDVIPDSLLLNVTNNIEYNSNEPFPEEYVVDELDFLDDFWLTPLDKSLVPFGDHDTQVTIDVVMDNLGNGVNYAFFNNITFVQPKVPTLGTVLSAPEDLLFNSDIYGPSIHPVVLEADEIVEIVLNNQDTGKHPFHLHGHIFEVYERGPDYGEEPVPVAYNESLPYTPRDTPMFRDTLYVNPQSYFVIKFKASNPGIWFFHCHIEWHLLQGLALTFIEDPVGIRKNQVLTSNWKETCNALGNPYVGNAAAVTDDYLDITNANVQVAPLPDGFTARGIVALVFSCISGILGCVVIAIYGMADTPPNFTEKVANELHLDERELFAEELSHISRQASASQRYSDETPSDDIQLDEIRGTQEKQ